MFFRGFLEENVLVLLKFGLFGKQFSELEEWQQ